MLPSRKIDELTHGFVADLIKAQDPKKLTPMRQVVFHHLIADAVADAYRQLTGEVQKYKEN